MARMEEIPEPTRSHIAALECPPPEGRPWVAGPPLAQRKVAMVTSAALHARSEAPFMPGSAEYRALPATLAPSDIVMSHVSINFDRSGFQRDLNTIYPIERLRALAAAGVIGGVAETHYSVMGSTDPATMEETAHAIVAGMRRERVEAALFLPV